MIPDGEHLASLAADRRGRPACRDYALEQRRPVARPAVVGRSGRKPGPRRRPRRRGRTGARLPRLLRCRSVYSVSGFAMSPSPVTPLEGPPSSHARGSRTSVPGCRYCRGRAGHRVNCHQPAVRRSVNRRLEGRRSNAPRARLGDQG